MADIIRDIIDDIQSDIDSGFYDEPDTFDFHEAVENSMYDKLTYDYDVIKYWGDTPGPASEEITRLMVEDITEYVNESISESDFNFPNNLTANRRVTRARSVNRRTARPVNRARRATNREVARRRYRY